MKFKDVPLYGLFKTKYDDCLKISAYKYLFSDNGNDFIESIDTETEVELVSKCANCKFYNQDIFGLDYGFYYCKKIKFNYPDGAGVEIKEDPEKFSCSLFEQKED